MPVCVLGGDLRQITLAKRLREKGFFVDVLGFDPEYASKENIENNMEKLKDATVVVLPVPAMVNDELNTPCYSGKITKDDILKSVNSSAIIFGGRMPQNLCDGFKKRHISFYDYMTEEELAVKNAVPTAEGAIELAMSETPFTLSGSRCMVLGWGRIGRILSKMLSGIGAKVTVAARRHESIAMAQALSMDTVMFDELSEEIPKAQIIFNTVPAMVLDGALLSKVDKDALIIDLASKPGGVAFDPARELGLKVIWALSIPGKVAPVTSGEIIADTILHKLEELGV